MKKTANKLFCVLLSAAMLFSLLPVFPAFAEDASSEATSGTCSKTINWNLDEDGTLTISGTGEMPRFGYHNDYNPGRISYINAPWKGVNYVNEKIKKVVIEEGVESVSDYAFDGYYSITEVSLPSGLTEIGRNAFHGCSSLKSITIPETVKTVGYYAFQGSGLESVTVASPDVIFGDNVFSSCSKLTEINLAEGISMFSSYIFSGTAWYKAQPDGLVMLNGIVFGYKGDMPENTEIVLPQDAKGIACTAFANCRNLVSVTIPDGVTQIGERAFASCPNLREIDIPDNIKKIGMDAFLGTAWYNAQPDGLVYAGKTAYDYKGTMPEGTDIVLADDTIALADNCFSGCEGLASVTIPAGVSTISKAAFYKCTGLTQFTVPSGVTSIGNSAFGKCSGLTEIHIPAGVTSIVCSAFSECPGLETITVDEDNAVYHAEGNCLIDTAAGKLIAGCKNSVIPADGSVTAIGAYAFKGCTGLTSLAVPDGIVSIGNDAFYGCTGLPGLTLPESMAVIGANAFCKCSGFTEFTVPDGITIISLSMFDQCTNLSNITIPDSVRAIDGDAFDGCSSLRNISIPYGVKIIGSYAFRGCGLRSVVIPNSVTHIGGSAFQHCGGLTDVTLSDHLIYIASNTFYDCDLRELILPDSVNMIDYRAFYRNVNLRTIHFGKNSGYVMVEAFEECRSIESITVDPENRDYSARGNCLIYLRHAVVLGCKNSVIPDDGSIERIDMMAFFHCTGLTEIQIPEGVAYIDEKAFTGCTGLTEVTLPESMLRIWYDAFKGCTGLTEMTFPESVRTIGYEAFNGCTNLKEITLTNRVTNNAGAFKECRSLTDVYYYGTEADWSSFLTSASYGIIGDLRNVTVHYLERTQQSNPTATEHGYTAGVYCHTCEEWYAGHEVIHNALGEITVMQAPTATEPGLYSAVCTVCGSAFLYEHPISEHIAGESVIENEIAPTCTEDGGYELVTYCAVCGGVIASEHVDSPALGHTYESAVTTAPTCTAEGVRIYTCTRCNDTYTETMPALGHGHTLGLNQSGVPSTCTVQGYEMSICLDCGEVVESTILPLDPTAHTWGEWTVATPATYLSEGLERRECTSCHAEETRALPKLVPDEIISDPDTGISLNTQQGVLPEGTTFEVDDVFDGTYFTLLNREVGNIESTMYNITPKADGENVQPDGWVLVRLPLPAGYDPANVNIYYISTETGVIERMDSYIEDGYICFQTNHFSVYAIVDASSPAEAPTENPTDDGGAPLSFFARIAAFFRSIAAFFRSIAAFFRSIAEWFRNLFNK